MECTEKFSSSEDSAQQRDVYQLVVIMYRDKNEFTTLSPKEIVSFTKDFQLDRIKLTFMKENLNLDFYKVRATSNFRY